MIKLLAVLAVAIATVAVVVVAQPTSTPGFSLDTTGIPGPLSHSCYLTLPSGAASGRYILGGQTIGPAATNAVYQSNTTTTTAFVRLTTAGPMMWSPRYNAACTVMTTASAAGPALVISGGQSATDIFADLWISYDGVHWTMPATIAVPWSQRYLHGLVFHAPTACLYVMGGDDGGINSELNDVWRSSDSGHTWTQLTAHAAWSGRSGFALISWGGLLRLFGGGNDAQNPPENVVNSELWTSVDGIQWSRVLAAGVPSARTGASFVGLDTGSSPLLALVGGYLSASATGVDIRISSDGVNWCAPANAAPTIDAVSSGWQALGPQSAVVWNTTIVFSVLVTNASNTAPGLLSITQPLSLLCDSSAVVWQLLRRRPLPADAAPPLFMDPFL